MWRHSWHNKYSLYAHYLNVKIKIDKTLWKKILFADGYKNFRSNVFIMCGLAIIIMSS